MLAQGRHLPALRQVLWAGLGFWRFGDGVTKRVASLRPEDNEGKGANR